MPSPTHPPTDTGAIGAERSEAFTLDTSGYVNRPGFARPLRWGDLSPLEQGYVNAALHSDIEYPDPAEGWGPSCAPKYDWLAPVTLAEMLRDCEGLSDIYSNTPAGGALFWADRARGSFIGLNPETRFPPVVLYLRDDGLLYSRQAPSPATTPTGAPAKGGEPLK